MSDDMGDVIFGVVMGVLLGLIITLVVALNASDNVREWWQLDAVTHGYAHYDIDHNWHWNNEKKE